MSTQIFPTQLLAPNVPWVDKEGSPVHAFYYLTQALFDRTGQNSGLPAVGSGLMAAGAGQTSALELGDSVNEVTGGSGGVRLDALHPGQAQTVFNVTGAALNVYPASMGQIDALAVDAPYSLPAGKSQIFTCCSSLPNSGGSHYRSLQLG